jgi:hypothetical protein
MPELFTKLVTKRLGRAIDIAGERGDDYGDTLTNCQWLAMNSIAKKLGLDISRRDLRRLAMAALVDIKYQRFEGGYKEDHIDDGINYQACLAELENQAEDEDKEEPIPPFVKHLASLPVHKSSDESSVKISPF